MRTITTWVSIIGLLAGGCTVVDRHHLDELASDGGGSDADAPGLQFDEVCNPPSVQPRMLLTDTATVTIDTTAYRNDNMTSCNTETPGNDVFIGVQVVAGARWHFHLRGAANHDPMLYLTRAGSCDSRTCQFVASSCASASDEHFAFEADADGLWYIGIDDGVEGGGLYTLEAYRLDCGDGVDLHGEGCDDGNNIDGDGCDRKCRYELSEERTVEKEPNDDRIEAHAIILPASNELEITGEISGGGGCTYPDVYAINVPQDGDLFVDALNSDGTPCASGATTPFRLSLLNARGDVVTENMQDPGTGCAIMHRSNLTSGEYFVRVGIPEPLDVTHPYRLRFRIAP
jgi:cysteine-rich repeat protein